MKNIGLILAVRTVFGWPFRIIGLCLLLCAYWFTFRTWDETFAMWLKREILYESQDREQIFDLKKALAKAIAAADGWHDDCYGNKAPGLDKERALLQVK